MKTKQLTFICLEAEEGYFLSNKEKTSFAKKIYLSDGDSPDNWIQITEQEYEDIQAKLQEEAERNIELIELLNSGLLD